MKTPFYRLFGLSNFLAEGRSLYKDPCGLPAALTEVALDGKTVNKTGGNINVKSILSMTHLEEITSSGKTAKYQEDLLIEL